MSDNWVVRKRPARLERRINFNNYEETREFLERSAELAESQGYYPDMSIGRTHVSITLHPQGEAVEVNEELMHYARLIDELVVPAAQLSN